MLHTFYLLISNMPCGAISSLYHVDENGVNPGSTEHLCRLVGQHDLFY